MNNRNERIKKLDLAVQTLKSEFIGLDKIIDEIKAAVYPWYITPEVIERPVVISLWGMTGTGKSSVVKRLIKLLDLDSGSVYVDCGEDLTSDKSITDRIYNSLGLDDDSYSNVANTHTETINTVFVFDEFQYARTINENGEEVDKTGHRPIWNLIDDGQVNMNGSYNYTLTRITNFIEDFCSLSDVCPDIKIENGLVKNKHDVKAILDEIIFWYDRDIPGYSETINKPTSTVKSEDNKDDSSDPYRPLEIIPNDTLRNIRKLLNRSDTGKSRGTQFLKDLLSNKYKTILDLCQVLSKIKKELNQPRKLDCSKSLVFIIGNLDEAYSSSSDISPDTDADVFHDITKRVTVSDIKIALKKRFRAEQIARLGNNLIKYPTLTKNNFEKIIDKEIDRILHNFNEKIDSSIKIEIKPEIKELLYSEGIFPTQGVRPVFSTIESTLTPYLSEIIINKKDTDSKVLVGIKDVEEVSKKQYKLNEVIVTLEFPDTTRTLEFNQKLQLGSDRNPEKCGTRYINSVHESGHAVVTAFLTGEVPIQIVSVSTDHGGFCLTYDKNKEGEIDSRHDLDVDVMIDLAGYVAEETIFDRPEMRLLGASSDISYAWDSIFRSSAWNGYFAPVSINNWETFDSPSGNPQGLNGSDFYVHYFDGKKFSSGKMKFYDAIEKRMYDLRDKVREIIRDEEKLIKKMALYLGEHGSMTKSTFSDFIEKYGNKLNQKEMEEVKKEYSYDYYKRILED